MFAVQVSKWRQLAPQFVPCCRGIQSSDQVWSGKCQAKTTLQGLLTLAKFVYQQGVTASAIGLLRLGQGGQFLGFRAGIIQCITGKLGSDLTGIGAELLHRRGKPFLNGAVHEPIGKKKQQGHGNKGEQQGAQHHTAAEF